MAAATVAHAAVALGALAIPSAADDDLKDKKRRSSSRSTTPTHDLEDSSTELRQRAGARSRPPRPLAAARAELADVRAELAAARDRDARCRSSWPRAEHG